jgi:hypothetical protein
VVTGFKGEEVLIIAEGAAAGHVPTRVRGGRCQTAWRFALRLLPLHVIAQMARSYPLVTAKA